MRKQRIGKITHGHARVGSESPTYKTWEHMIRRCENPADIGYKHYGAKGIAVCERWRRDFTAFLSDMGPRPDGMTLDRIDTSGNYEPSNCRWATAKQQARNNSRSRMLTAFGKTQNVTAWADELKINPQTIRVRLWRGYSDQLALTGKEVA